MDNAFFDKKYAQICSEKTLQTSQQGFFSEFANGICESVGENWIKNTFGKLKSDSERIRIIYQDKTISNYVIEFLSNVREIYRGKCAKTARMRRKEAEDYLKKEDYRKAAALFSQSILKAPSGEDLALSLLGRAKAHIFLEDYSSAIEDLQLCLKDSFFDNSKGEIFGKLAICYKRLGDENRAAVSLKLAERFLMDDSLKKLQEEINKNSRNLKSAEKFLKDDSLKKLQEEINKNSRNPKSAERFLKDDSLKKLHEEMNQNSGNVVKNKKMSEELKFKNKISIKTAAEFGRYGVANSNIKTGETLAVEDPYAACLVSEKFGKFCQHCFERLVTPLGCPDCSSLAFCKQKCKESAYYHKFECKFLDLLIGSGMSVLSHVALRIITQNSLEKTLENYKNRSRINVFNLCTNSKKRSPGDMLQRALMASFLLRILQCSGYFKEIREIPAEEEFKVGELLLYSLQMLQFNAHEIYETLHSEENPLKEAIPTYIGVGVYPSSALLNHDCYPGVTRYFLGKQMVINAVRPLKPGDIIAENYGPIFTWRKLGDRQRSLSARYWFNCRCIACVEDWPSLNGGLDSATKRVKCLCGYLLSLPVSKILKCPKCKEVVDLTENLEKLKWCEGQYDLAFDFLEKGDAEEMIKILCPAIDVFHRVSAPPHRETHLAQEMLRACLADKGNTHIGKSNKSNKM